MQSVRPEHREHIFHKTYVQITMCIFLSRTDTSGHTIKTMQLVFPCINLSLIFHMCSMKPV